MSIITSDTLNKIPATVEDCRVSILVPVYNGGATITRLIDTVIEALSQNANLHEIILVNDGSQDNSHEIILEIIERYPNYITYVQLFRNFGEHNAVMCGLNQMTGDVVVIIDDDFQNPPSEIRPLIVKLLEGYDVVYSYYEKKQHNIFRNIGSGINDKVATVLLSKPSNLYLSSFKAISAPLVNIITHYTGPFPYIDGLILRSTTNIGTQLVKHVKREDGRSGYTLGKLLSLWMNMFTGFSIMPLRVATYLGFFFSIFSIALALFFIYIWIYGSVFIKNEIPPGWASTMVLITFFVGLQLSILGIVGEYLGRLFLTINDSPQYLVREIHEKQKDADSGE
jgi:polyisoprenyl-phosphate glycosyltransferase